MSSCRPLQKDMPLPNANAPAGHTFARPSSSRAGFWLAGLLTCAVLSLLRASDPVVLYTTGFEFWEGYRTAFTLTGQNGWVGAGDGGSGIVTNYLEGAGQQAYVGAFPPSDGSDFFSVWRPVNVAPVPPALPVLTFSVRMQIEESLDPRYQDDFRWSAYNTNGNRLFSLDFDTSTRTVNYLLDDGQGFKSTGFGFETGGAYDLVVSMNFQRNLWSAWLNDTLLATGRRISTQAAGAALNLGDIDAVWSIRDPDHPGDNYMLFDDYEITADDASAFRPRLEVMGFIPQRGFTVRMYGEPGLGYILDASTDQQVWTPISTNSTPSGVFDVVDVEAHLFDRQFYRARVWQH